MDNFDALKRARDKALKVKEDKYKDDSKRKLKDIIERKIRTSFIGSLSAFEEQFGFLVRKEGIVPTPEQERLLQILEQEGFDTEYFNKLWIDARTKALNNGNNQIRGIQQELNQYTIHWDRYTVQLPVKPLDEDN